jgi:hypothetical protein
MSILLVRCRGDGGKCGHRYALLDGKTIQLEPVRCGHVIELLEPVNGEWRLKPFVADALLAALASDSQKPKELLLRPATRHARKDRNLAAEEAWSDWAEAAEDKPRTG